MNEWIKQQVFASRAQYMLVQMARQCGKSKIALEYAIDFCLKNANKKLLFITPYRAQQDQVWNMIQEKCPNVVTRNSDKTITFLTSSSIHFISLANEIDARMRLRGTCGMRVDKIVIDEAGIVPFSEEIHVLGFGGGERAQTLMFTTELWSGSYMARIRDTRPSSAMYLSYDYHHALQDQLFTPQFIFELKERFTEERFQKEFGPFEPLIQVDNEAFMHKLRSLSELEEEPI